MSLLLGLFDRPADADCLKALLKVPAIPDLTEPLVGTSEAHRNLAFTRLQDAKLLTVNRTRPARCSCWTLTRCCANILRGELREQRPEAWRASRGLARRPPAALGAPLRDNEGQSPAQLPTF